MGSGKSTVGHLVAESLRWRFVDLDEAVAERAGLSIPEIFESRGEPHFRNLERRELMHALGGPKESVVACGGGVVTDPRNRARLVEVPTVFLWEDTDRPLSQDSWPPGGHFGAQASRTSHAGTPNVSHTTWRSRRSR
jgi:shikimate kinase